MSKKRGRETALDMLRTLAVVFAVVLPLWYFGQASQSDKAKIRPVDPTEALAAFHAETDAPVPTTPEGWTVTVARGDVGEVRVGYVIGEHYTEFNGGSGATYLEDVTGKGRDRGPVSAGGAVWRYYVSADGRESLVRVVGRTTLVVGGVREDVTQAQLTVLAATVR
jgi:hypothetical protein